MSHNWNISLFHYRNNGADYGRVAVGMQVPADEMNEWQQFLNSLGYRFIATGMKVLILLINCFWVKSRNV